MKNIRSIVFSNAWRTYRNSTAHTKTELSKLLKKEWAEQKELFIYRNHKSLINDRIAQSANNLNEIIHLGLKKKELTKLLESHFEVINSDFPREFLIKSNRCYLLKLKNSEEYLRIGYDYKQISQLDKITKKLLSSVITYIKTSKKLTEKLKRSDTIDDQIQQIKVSYINQILKRLSFPCILKSHSIGDNFKILKAGKKLIFLDQNIVINSKTGKLSKRIPYEQLYFIAEEISMVILPQEPKKRIERKMKIEELQLV